MCSKNWVTQQYDHFVRGNTALAQPDDAGVVRVDENTGRGIAISTDANGIYGYLNPYEGARAALAEAYRNVATVGARPLAVTDCLNFGSPEDPAAMWQLVQGMTGLADACQTLEIPVTGGNVSLYNRTGEVSIHPTPVVGVLGVMENVQNVTVSGFRNDGEIIVLIGQTKCELDGSQWAYTIHKHLGGQPPVVDLHKEKQIAELLITGSQEKWLIAAHDISQGGLVQTLVDMCLRWKKGAKIELAGLLDSHLASECPDLATLLFSETGARCVVSIDVHDLDRLAQLAHELEVPYCVIGTVKSGGR